MGNGTPKAPACGLTERRVMMRSRSLGGPGCSKGSGGRSASRSAEPYSEPCGLSAGVERILVSLIATRPIDH